MAQPDLNALIVANIVDLDAAAFHLDNRLQHEIGEALDDVSAKRIGELGWEGVTDWNDDAIWAAPKEWRKSDGSPGDEYACQFSFEASSTADGEADYFWLTQLVGMGRATLGFRWARNDISKARWRKAVGQQTDLIGDIRGLGFVYGEKDGSFFLPVVIDPTKLSSALMEESPEQALEQPLADAFSLLVRSKALFDSLLERTALE